jgi:hypothetical protein
MHSVASARCGWRLTGVGSRCFPRPVWPGKQGVAFLADDMVEVLAILSCRLSPLWLAGDRGRLALLPAPFVAGQAGRSLPCGLMAEAYAMLPVAAALCGWRLTGVVSRCFPRPLWPGKQGVASLAGDTI